MFLIFEVLLLTNLCFVCTICCLCCTLVHVIHGNKTNSKDEYTQVNIQSDIPLLIVHPNNDMDIGNNS